MGSASSTGSATNAGSASGAGSVSEETKKTVADYKIRWDKQVETTQEMVAALERHIKAGARTKQAEGLGPVDKARFTQGKLQALVGQTFTGSVDETALKADLDRVINRFQREDKALRPNMSAALAANPGMLLSENGNVIVEGDEGIDTSSLVGVANAVVMNAKARGEDPGAAVDYLRAEMMKKMKENPPLMVTWQDDASKVGDTSSNLVTAQSLYVGCPSWPTGGVVQGGSCQRWPGSIPYTFADSTDRELVQAVEAAMQDWTDKTSGKVRFHPYQIQVDLHDHKFPSTSKEGIGCLSSPFYGIPPILSRDSPGVVHIVRSYEVNGSSSADVGYGMGIRLVRINNKVFSNKDELKRHTRHELGHVIGLLHEHQRWDRDAFVEIPIEHQWDGVNHGKLDLYSSIGMHSLVFEPQLVYFPYFTCWGGLFNLTCGWRQGSFTTWYPVWKYVELKRERTAYGSDHFDCNSIMLYGGLPIKPLSMYPDCFDTVPDGIGGVWGRFTKYNTEISPQDAATAAGLIAW